MSRIGKFPVTIPAGTTVEIVNGVLTVKGPKGEISKKISPLVTIEVKDNEIVVNPVDQTVSSRAMWGTFASHAKSMVIGVNDLFSKKLQVEGVGYRWSVEGNKVVVNVGFSHPVNMEIPEGLTAEAVKNDLTISGIDKEVVGQFAANIRKLRKPEPYKGKGIRYEGEIIRRKQGKRAV